MSKHLIQAKLAISIVSKSSSHAENVLSEIIRMSTIKKGLSSKELMLTIPPKFNMSTSLFRKTIHELKKLNLVIKGEDHLYKINSSYIKI